MSTAQHVIVDHLDLKEAADQCYACYVYGAVASFENSSKTCHVFLVQRGTMREFSFAGTEDFEEWLVDFAAVPEVQSGFEHLGPIHTGFWINIASSVQWIVNELKKDELQTPFYYLYGHSKGAGEVILAAAWLKHLGFPPALVIAFEPPKVGHEALLEYLSDVEIYYTVTSNTHGQDLVTMVPPSFGWVHCGQRIDLMAPDNFGAASKHKMVGVFAGLEQLEGV